ncbi:MAG: hypothetical protein AAGB05_09475 [Pseudomonadota bacterium]
MRTVDILRTAGLPPGMKNILTACALALSLCVPTGALADARASFLERGQTLFSFAIPDFWSLTTGGARELTLPGTTDARPVPQILSIRPSVEPTVWMAFYAPRGVRTFEEGRDYLREVGQFLANAPQVTDDTVRRIGGRPAEVVKGTGRRDGTALQFVVALIDLPGPRIAIAAAVIEAGAPETAFDAVNDVFASFRAGQ